MIRSLDFAREQGPRTARTPVALAAVLLAAALGAGSLGARQAFTEAGHQVRGLPAPLEGRWSVAYGEHAGPTGTIEGAAGWSPVELPLRLGAGSGSSWDGHVWLAARFRVADDLGGRPLALRFRRLCDADEVFLNGVRIGGTGRFPPGFSAARALQRVYPLPGDALRFGEENELVLHLFALGRTRCPIPEAPAIGGLEVLLREAAVGSAVVAAFAVFFAMVAANHLLLPFFLPRTAARPNLVFALFAATSAAYVALHLPFLAEGQAAAGVVDRVRLALLPVAVVLLAEFVHAFFERRPPVALRALQAGLAAAAAVPLAAPSALLWFPFAETVFLLTAGLAALVGRLVVSAIGRGVDYARPLGLVLLVYALSGLWDLACDLGLVPRVVTAGAGLLFPIGFVPFSVVMGLILAHRYWQHYRLATSDSLTDLLRREPFLARLGEEIERAARTRQTVVAAMIDLDGFKRVNDTIGHAAGDLVLQSTARLLRTSLRPFDLVGRWGGDELCAALVVDADGEGLAALDRVRLAVASQHYELGGRSFRLTASIGAARTSGERVSPSQLLATADRALYRAKNAGGDRVELDARGATEAGEGRS